MFYDIYDDGVTYKVAKSVTKIDKENKEVQYECAYTGDLASCRNYMAKKAIKTWKEGKKKPSWSAHFWARDRDSIVVRVDYTYYKYTITTFEIV